MSANTEQSVKDRLARDGTPAVSETVNDFLEYLRVEEGRASGTLDRYRGHLEGLIVELGDVLVTAIDAECISIYKRKLMDRGLSPASIAGVMSCLRSLLRYLGSVRGLSVYPAEKVRRPRIPKREVEYLAVDELERFLEAIPTHRLAGLRDRALAEILFSSGMRISEAVGLSRTDVDWEAREARIIGKGNKERWIYLSERALAWLQRYVERRWDDDPALFVSHMGEAPIRMRANRVWERFHRYGRDAGLAKNVYPHMLRHTMATALLANGCPIGHIRTLLGHENLATTCKYYLGVITNAEAKAAHERHMPEELWTDRRTDGNERAG